MGLFVPIFVAHSELQCSNNVQRRWDHLFPSMWSCWSSSQNRVFAFSNANTHCPRVLFCVLPPVCLSVMPLWRWYQSEILMISASAFCAVYSSRSLKGSQEYLSCLRSLFPKETSVFIRGAAFMRFVQNLSDCLQLHCSLLWCFSLQLISFIKNKNRRSAGNLQFAMKYW